MTDEQVHKCLKKLRSKFYGLSVSVRSATSVAFIQHIRVNITKDDIKHMTMKQFNEYLLCHFTFLVAEAKDRLEELTKELGEA